MDSCMAPMQHVLAQALEDLHERMAGVILGLDGEALEWRPIPGIATIRELVDRAVIEEHHWLGEGVAGLPPSVAQASAAGTGQADDHPLFRLGSAGQASQMILSELAADDWVSERRVDGRSLTVAACLLYVLQELARTLGQVEIVAGLWKGGNDAGKHDAP